MLRNLWALIDNDLPLLNDDLVYYKVDGLVEDSEIEEIKNAIKEVKEVAYKGSLDSKALSHAYVTLSSIYFKKPLPPEMKIRLDEAKGRLSAILSKLNVDLKKLDEEANARLQEKMKAVQQKAQQQGAPQGAQKPVTQGQQGNVQSSQQAQQRAPQSPQGQLQHPSSGGSEQSHQKTQQ